MSRPSFVKLSFFNKLGLTVLIGVIGTPIFAQGLYRCGNTYQDKPCVGEAGKKIAGGVVNNAKPTTVLKPVDAACVQRGEEAKKIVWAREGGMGEQQMLGKAKTDEEKKLVADVYKVRGGANDVKVAMEAACVAEKTALAAGQAVPAAAGAASAASANAAASAGKTVASAPASGVKSDAATGPSAEEKKRNCDQLRAQLEAAVIAQRSTPSVSIDIPKQRKENEASLAKLGC